MKSIIYNFLLIVIGVLLYFIIFKYFFIKFDITGLIHDIIEPEKEAYIGLSYLGYVYFIYSLIWISILLIISHYIKKNKYAKSNYILIIIFALIGLYGLYMQFSN